MTGSGASSSVRRTALSQRLGELALRELDRGEHVERGALAEQVAGALRRARARGRPATGPPGRARRGRRPRRSGSAPRPPGRRPPADGPGEQPVHLVPRRAATAMMPGPRPISSAARARSSGGAGRVTGPERRLGGQLAAAGAPRSRTGVPRPRRLPDAERSPAAASSGASSAASSKRRWDSPGRPRAKLSSAISRDSAIGPVALGSDVVAPRAGTSGPRPRPRRTAPARRRRRDPTITGGAEPLGGGQEPAEVPGVGLARLAGVRPSARRRTGGSSRARGSGCPAGSTVVTSRLWSASRASSGRHLGRRRPGASRRAAPRRPLRRTARRTPRSAAAGRARAR